MYNIKLISKVIVLSKAEKIFIDRDTIVISTNYYNIHLVVRKKNIIIYNYWKFGIVGSFLFRFKYKQMNFSTNNIKLKLHENNYKVDLIFKNN